VNDLLGRLASLPDAEPSAMRADRVRALARQRLTPPRRAASGPSSPRRRPPLLSLSAGVVSAVYVVNALGAAVEVLAARFRS